MRIDVAQFSFSIGGVWSAGHVADAGSGNGVASVVVARHISREVATVVNDGDFHVGLAILVAANHKGAAVAVVEPLTCLSILDGNLGIFMRSKNQVNLP